MSLPSYLFFTGVPGSRWSGISQVLETIPGMNTSDRRPDRNYTHHRYTGHVGTYFGKGMEFDAIPSIEYINQAWTDPGGCKVIKSHDWAYYLNKLKTIQENHNSWIMLVYRPDMASYAWWHEAGGFQIKYPCYDAYKDSINMMNEIMNQNKAILEFGMQNNCTWHYFTAKWVKDNFDADVAIPTTWPDILVTIIKNE